MYMKIFSKDPKKYDGFCVNVSKITTLHLQDGFGYNGVLRFSDPSPIIAIRSFD